MQLHCTLEHSHPATQSLSALADSGSDQQTNGLISLAAQQAFEVGLTILPLIVS